MSSNKTPYLKLHAWEARDQFRREEFNENFSLLDAALSNAASSIADTAASAAAAVASVPYVKLLETATAAAARSVDFDLSGIDLSAYDHLEISLRGLAVPDADADGFNTAVLTLLAGGSAAAQSRYGSADYKFGSGEGDVGTAKTSGSLLSFYVGGGARAATAHPGRTDAGASLTLRWTEPSARDGVRYYWGEAQAIGNAAGSGNTNYHFAYARFAARGAGAPGLRLAMNDGAPQALAAGTRLTVYGVKR